MSQLTRLEELTATGRIWRMGDLADAGVAAATVRRAVVTGRIEQLSRGLYRASGAPHVAHVHLAEAVARIPRGIVCMHSAARAHGFGDESPARVWVAIPNKVSPAKILWPPIRYVRWRDEAAFVQGVDETEIGGIRVRMTNPARTVIDMMRMSATVGEHQALACLRDYLGTGRAPADLHRLAAALSVEKRLSPLIRAASVAARAA